MKDTNLANTAFRAIEILRKLSFKPCPIEELADGFSDDTLRIYLNALKSCGVKISSLSRTNKNYSLLENLDFLNFNQKEFLLLTKIKNRFALADDYEAVMDFNNLLVHFSAYTDKENAGRLQKIIFASPFSYEKHDFIKEIEKYIKDKTPLLLTYLSPNSATNYFKILPKYLKIKNSKIYLCAVDNSIKSVRYLLLDRIKNIKKLNEPYAKSDVLKSATCAFFGRENIVNDFDKCEIIERSGDKITAKIYYESEFSFLQNILAYGSDCRIIKPADLKKRLLQKLIQTEVLYEKYSQ